GLCGPARSDCDQVVINHIELGISGSICLYLGGAREGSAGESFFAYNPANQAAAAPVPSAVEPSSPGGLRDEVHSAIDLFQGLEVDRFLGAQERDQPQDLVGLAVYAALKAASGDQLPVDATLFSGSQIAHKGNLRQSYSVPLLIYGPPDLYPTESGISILELASVKQAGRDALKVKAEQQFDQTTFNCPAVARHHQAVRILELFAQQLVSSEWRA